MGLFTPSRICIIHLWDEHQQNMIKPIIVHNYTIALACILKGLRNVQKQKYHTLVEFHSCVFCEIIRNCVETFGIKSSFIFILILWFKKCQYTAISVLCIKICYFLFISIIELIIISKLVFNLCSAIDKEMGCVLKH